MQYITKEDLLYDSYEVFVKESTKDTEGVIEAQEKRTLEIVRTYLMGRYDLDLIFSFEKPLRNEMLIDIISKITLYKIFRRNAPRKIPQNVEADYKEALKRLENLQAGKMTLLDLPTLAENTKNGGFLWGNNKNENFYI